MADDRSTTPEAGQADSAAQEPAAPVFEPGEELVDEISIDGMCGVY